MVLRSLLFRAGAASVLGSALALAALIGPASAQRRDVVDLELVLAVDVSSSMDEEEQRVQRDGYVQAFRHKSVLDAIRSGTGGRIAVTYVEWAANPVQTVPWMIISNAAEAKAFADRLASEPLYTERRTSLANAIDYSVQLLETNPISAVRRVIDISGDGVNNWGDPVTAARDKAVAKNITINGIPLLMNQGSQFIDAPELDKYYRDCVIGGQGAFVIPVKTIDAFAGSVRTKLVSEIADLTPVQVPGQPRFQLAQATRPAPRAKANCLVGEQRGFGGGGAPFTPPNIP